MSKSFECIVFSSHIIRLHALHMPSTPWVCAPVAGSTRDKYRVYLYYLWINKIQRVVHCTVYVPRCCCLLIAGTPFIGAYNTPWLYVICDNWEQCSCISMSNFYQKNVSAASLHAPKHPMAIHSSPIIFSLPKFALIDFDLDTWTGD